MTTKLFDLDTKRCDAILNASLKEFALKGFDKASTNIIAKEAAISKSLMFHYVGSKQELFLLVFDYFSEALNKEYFDLINYDERDIFNKLKQSYILQIRLLNKYPCILEFSKLSRTTNSDEINKELEKREQNQHLNCYPNLFDKIDESKFRKTLNIEQCKQIILWSNIGFTKEILDEIHNSNISKFKSEIITQKIDEYFDELRKLFYA